MVFGIVLKDLSPAVMQLQNMAIFKAKYTSNPHCYGYMLKPCI